MGDGFEGLYEETVPRLDEIGEVEYLDSVPMSWFHLFDGIGS